MSGLPLTPILSHDLSGSLPKHFLVHSLLFFPLGPFALSETLELARYSFIVLCYRKCLDEHLLCLFIFLERDLSEALSIQRLCYSPPQ